MLKEGVQHIHGSLDETEIRIAIFREIGTRASRTCWPTRACANAIPASIPMAECMPSSRAPNSIQHTIHTPTHSSTHQTTQRHTHTRHHAPLSGIRKSLQRGRLEDAKTVEHQVDVDVKDAGDRRDVTVVACRPLTATPRSMAKAPNRTLQNGEVHGKSNPPPNDRQYSYRTAGRRQSSSSWPSGCSASCPVVASYLPAVRYM